MSKNLDLGFIAFEVMKYFLPFLFALCFHEFAHGYVARMRGDRTAELMGRLTLNPLAHADPIGTFLLPIMGMVMRTMGMGMMMFGWAKPVPVDSRNLKNPKADMFWIAFAGPLSNLLLAFIGAIVLGVVMYSNGMPTIDIAFSETGKTKHLFEAMTGFIGINVALAVFNLIPVHPLDGGKILARFLPDRINDKLEEMQNYFSMALLLLFVTGAFSFIFWPIRYLSAIFLVLAQNVAGAL